MATPRQVTVTGRFPLSDGVLGLQLVASDGLELPHWEAGAHVDLVLPGGMVRQYSLCGDPADRGTYLIAVLRVADGRGGSAYLHDRVVAGDTLRFIGPRNRFPLASAGPYVFIAGGIGITPILPMIREAATARTPWRLIYGGRSRSSMAFVRDLERFEGRVTIVPEDEQGLPDVVHALRTAPDDAAIYCCGPDGLLNATAEAMSTLGRPMESLHVERFVPAAASVLGSAPHQDDGGQAQQPFDIVLASTGTTLTVPAGVSILDVLEAAGQAPLSSCRAGTCGTCETTVLAGVPDHRDSLLTEEERAANDIMFICVSRARSERLVLDL